MKREIPCSKVDDDFMEYPIIYIGYSLNDSDIQNILKDILLCLPNDKIERLQERFVFVDYRQGTTGYSITPYTLTFGEQMLSMTRLTLSDLVFYMMHWRRKSVYSCKDAPPF